MAIGRTNAANKKYDVEEKTTVLSMASGDQVITPSTGKFINKVTITKPSTLIAENIKKGIDIGGVVGTLESDITTGCNITINVLTYNVGVTTDNVGVHYSVDGGNEFLPIEAEGTINLENVSTIMFMYVGYPGGGVMGPGSYCIVGTEEKGKNIINAGDNEYNDTIITPRIKPNDGDIIYVEMEYN